MWITRGSALNSGLNGRASHARYPQTMCVWFDEATGKVFCLIDAPNKEAAVAVHREAHGLVADTVTEVTEGV